MIYLPIDDFSSYKCYSVIDKDTIRAYEQIPQNDSTSNYTDFYINSHYLTKAGTQTWNGYYSNLPVCFDSSKLSNAYVYRNDICEILIVFVLLVLIVYIPMDKLIKAFFRGRRHY